MVWFYFFRGNSGVYFLIEMEGFVIVSSIYGKKIVLSYWLIRLGKLSILVVCGYSKVSG